MNILDSILAQDLREQGCSDEEIIDEMVEFAEIFDDEKLALQVEARIQQEAENIRKELARGRIR